MGKVSGLFLTSGNYSFSNTASISILKTANHEQK